MVNIFNMDNIPNEYTMDFLGKANTSYLGKLAGSDKLYVNIDRISPGAKSAKYHSHTKQEEFFIILSGYGTLRIDGKEYLVKKGDFVSKPAGKGIAHQFINTGEEVLEILDVGTKEEGDIAYYPDEEIYYFSDENLVFNVNSKLSTWDSEPNK
ncbi:cupin domain-containing protein [Lachnoclostridium phytofermentans]|uniref:Cupin 2 conserved barrel domain protein n=1 Tax=Lachnoclostridium phytofermentans (strain ATCC 700394 / DSM 18823 / ISDg) TaxID=357809 RepID=A9KJB5_LACP7|nr:cupin domain-containing protein [Lachnoclostridium phytofermentans]ABX42527.1 Cupin 2 conserved barrel domain protein [Lachnoclostridium phytofermentans ISDg]